jgi:acyl-CoA synthetase (AMP-forming)/AMP-acid ligase II
VPTIHEILLVRADADHAPARSGLRFVRSCSSALSPATLKRLEDRFAAPVVEAYAMTETTHQATSNPLPPGAQAGDRRPRDERRLAIPGKRLEAWPGAEGSRRRGDRVRGCAHNPATTGRYRRLVPPGDPILDRASSPRGDRAHQGLINRGGEKISPSQVDAVLLGHPAIAMAASFGVPDPIYGEEIQAAVVLRAAATATEVQAYCRGHLSAFEIPKVIHIVDALPKNAAGKLDRRRLTEQFSR